MNGQFDGDSSVAPPLWVVNRDVFTFCLIPAGAPSIERGYQASLKTATYVFGGQVLVPPGRFVIYAVALVNS
jgi:hypothetical protein